MERKASRKVAIAGVIVLLILLLALLVVPTITAENTVPIEGVGYTVASPDQCYFALTATTIVLHAADVFIVEKPGSPFPDDVVVLLKCQADLSDLFGGVDPPATNYSGSGGGQCKIDLASPASDSTNYWSQTVSSSHKATLICQFKSNNGNN